MNLILRQLKPCDEVSFKKGIKEFSEHNPGWDFAFAYNEKVLFKDYVKMINGWRNGENLPEGFVKDSYMVAVVKDEIVGRVSIRHELNDFLFCVGGNIGYGVVPSHRKKGYSKEILSQALIVAKDLGLSKVLITCDKNNIASKKTIEINGGTLDQTENSEFNKNKLRYWIEVK